MCSAEAYHGSKRRVMCLRLQNLKQCTANCFMFYDWLQISVVNHSTESHLNLI